MGTRPGPGGERKLLSLRAHSGHTVGAGGARLGRGSRRPESPPGGRGLGEEPRSRPGPDAGTGSQAAAGEGAGRPGSQTPPAPDSAGRRRAPATPASRGEKYPAEKESQGSLAREARAEAGPAGAGVTWDLPMVGPGVPGLIAG